ncbi:MAG: nucleoside hydrolase [Bacillota bacterium]|jgi:pyrimidine-specific ribonucleoside hydrolase
MDRRPSTIENEDNRIPVLIDCDPGHDDAIALMLAFGCGMLDVLGVTTVAGNGTGLNTYNNARRILSFLGETEVPVGRGADRPLLRPLVTAQSVHGETALGGIILPDPREGGSAATTALDLMTEVLRAAAMEDDARRGDGVFGRKVTLIATGPLTNVAIMLLARPELKAGLDGIVLMGGAVGQGNWTPSAEFNIHVDPEAAKIVFESGLPITMIGLDVTHKAVIYLSEIESLRTLGRVGKTAAELLDFYWTSYRKKGFPGCPIHDAVAVAHVVLPGLVRTKSCRVDVETRGELTTGRTIADFSDRVMPNCRVGLDIQRERFIRALMDSVRALSQP